MFLLSAASRRLEGSGLIKQNAGFQACPQASLASMYRKHHACLSPPAQGFSFGWSGSLLNLLALSFSASPASACFFSSSRVPLCLHSKLVGRRVPEHTGCLNGVQILARGR